MKQLKVQIISAGILLLLVLLPFVSNAQVPGQIGFQGYLTDKMGIPVDGDHDMVFSLYTVATGGDLPFWSDTLTVDVENGIYNVILGHSGNALLPDDFDGDIYLGVRVGPDPDEMTPRQKLTSTAFALKAAISEFAVNADTLDGQDSADFDQSAHVGDINNPHGVTALQTGAVEAAIYTAHAGNSSAHHTKTDSFKDLYDLIDDGQIPDEITRDSEMDKELSNKADIIHNHDSRYYTEAEVNSIVTNLQGQIDDLKALLLNVTRVGNDITFSGVNVHIVNGTDMTVGTVNGFGNLIVGYNEERPYNNNRTGSHNIIVGTFQNYSSFGGLVAGFGNTISGDFASVSGGSGNTASGNRSSVSGGSNNDAIGYISSVSGGMSNTASGDSSSVSGGIGNTASGSYSSASGGYLNTASGVDSSVSGGTYNIASGRSAFIGGGGGAATEDGNIAFADYSAVLGGIKNIAGDPDLTNHSFGLNSSVSGGDSNKASSYASSVNGGEFNTASGGYSTVSGGYNRTVTGIYDWRAGDLFEDQ